MAITISLRLQSQQRCQDAARGAAGTHNQDPPADDDETEVVAQVADEPRAIGVVAENGSVLLHRQRVDRTCMGGAGGELVGDVDGGDFVRQRDVQAAAALGEKLPDPRLKLLRA